MNSSESLHSPNERLDKIRTLNQPKKEKQTIFLSPLYRYEKVFKEYTTTE